MLEKFYTDNYLIYKFKQNPSKKLFIEAHKRSIFLEIPYSVFKSVVGFNYIESLCKNERYFEEYKYHLNTGEVEYLMGYSDYNSSELNKLMIRAINRDETSRFRTDYSLLELCLERNINLKLTNYFKDLPDLIQNSIDHITYVDTCKILAIYDIEVSEYFLSYLMLKLIEENSLKEAKWLNNKYKSRMKHGFIEPILKGEKID